ncbi:nuclear exosome regulator NRDE2 [Eupeodes corollae]|uniref:nuclear exosome regulator NRDE2 n=1 Tax=Eupeodes corollae TaxID=290404 RepID=UPI002491D90E|nr:nuclear exosome regulator NRDE2 [Eupeodes corollae]
MSLFPAYADTTTTVKDQNEPPTIIDPATSSNSTWLENSSFNKLASEILPDLITSKETLKTPPNSTEIQDETSKESKSVKKSKKKRHRSPKPQPVILEFTGDEEFYIDKKGATQYRTIKTLHKPACPRYRLRYHRTYGGSSAVRTIKHFKRYFKSDLCREARTHTSIIVCPDENTFTQASTDLNRKIAQNPSEDSYWVELVQLQDRNPYKWSKTFLSEKKLEILQRALFHHLGNETLYRLYVDIANASYPSFEVSKIIDKLISKDPYNYVLWTSQILTTQCTMARCIVPDVLKIYEQCMQKMHRKLQDDSIMLKLFNNCALFLRQAGLNELFFALILLALELNVSPDQFSSLKPLEKDQQTLIEYEELVLQSGLPMNEIWLRIEKLRQSFNFLPCPENTQCSDPQRIVFNEDICYYIYPLQQRDNSFYMILIILRLLKVPLVNSCSLRRRFNTQVENIGDTDAIEDILVVLLNNYKCPGEKFKDFYEAIFELSKEVCVCPTFLNTTIGHEIYAKTIHEILLTCASTFEGLDERKRILFIQIWLRFERVLLILQKLANKLDVEYKKNLRAKVKQLFKKEQNRNVLNFYTEYALLEYEMGDLHTCEVIFGQILTGNDHENVNSDLSNAYVCYVNILIKENQLEKALKVLMCYSLNLPLDQSLESSSNFTAVRRQSGLKKLSDRLDALVEIEKNVHIMELEQYFFSDFLLNLLRMKTWYLYILGNKLEAMAYLEIMLRHFVEKNERHKFVREQVYELLISLMQCDSSTCIVSNVLIFDKITQAMIEFPGNLFFLQSCTVLHNQPWFKMRSVILRSNSIFSIIFLIAMARIRCKRSNKHFDVDDITPWDEEHNEKTYKNRILNLLRSLEGTTLFQRNALYWRFYMRCLSDSRTPFETTKKCLLAALDDCPWNKAIYLDGAIFVPQELSHLQDLLIEKQLRVCALPEELEILRDNNVQA